MVGPGPGVMGGVVMKGVMHGGDGARGDVGVDDGPGVMVEVVGAMVGSEK